MQNNKTAFTLVEMIVAMAVSAIIIAATYASYDIVKTQYKKNLDVAEMHQSGRGIMQMIERDIRMAGFNYIDKDAKTTYGPISKPLIIKDSGNNCCDEVTVIYDYVEDVLDWKGKLVSSSVNRIRIHYWTEAYTSKKGDRYRLYKQKDILGKNNALLDKPINGIKEVMADYIEDLQFVNITSTSSMYAGSSRYGVLRPYDPVNKVWGAQERLTYYNGTIINVMALAFGPDNLLYAGSYWYGRIRPFDSITKIWKKGIALQNYQGRDAQVKAMAFGPDGLLYAGSGTFLRGFKAYNPTDGTWGSDVNFYDKRGYAIPVTAMAFGPDGLLYVGSDHWGVIRPYDPVKKTWGEQLTFRGRNGTVHPISTLAFGPDGKLYIGSEWYGVIVSYDPVTTWWGRQNIFTDSNGQPIPVTSMAFGSDGLLYVGSRTLGVLRSFDPSDSSWSSEERFTDNRGTVIPVSSLAIKTKKSGQESLVSINLTLRAKNEYGKLRQFIQKDYHGGNYKLDKTDRYKRDTFSSSVLARNLML